MSQNDLRFGTFQINESKEVLTVVNIVHCGDLHLDSPLLSRLVTKQTLRNTFESICEYSKNSGANIVLLCGDIFDNEYVSGATASFLLSALEKYNMLEFFICSGNHDYFSSKSVYNEKFPQNVHLFINAEIEKVDLPKYNTAVYGFGCTSAHSTIRFLKDFKVEETEKTNIMMFHGNLIDGNSEDQFFPLTTDDISKTGLDYLALGHIHKHNGIKRAGETYYSYCGTPQGRGFDETGLKGIVAGTVGKGRQSLSFVPVCKTAFEVIKCDITDIDNILSLKDKIISDTGKFDKDALRVILTGEVPPDFIIDVKPLEESLKETFFYIEIKDNTSVKVDLEALSNKRTLKGLFVKELFDLKDENNTAEIQKAIKFGFLALSGEGEFDLEN